MLIGVVSTYQNADGLYRTLESLEPGCDSLVVVDGCYELFPEYESVFSTDDTIEVCMEFDVDLYQLSASQPVKRSFCYCGSVGDWYIRLDDDEVIDNVESIAYNMNSFTKDWYWVPLMNHHTQTGRPSNVLRLPRLFRHVLGIHHRGESDERVVDVNGHPTAVLEGEAEDIDTKYSGAYYRDMYEEDVVIHHYPEERPLERRDKKTEFYSTRVGDRYAG